MYFNSCLYKSHLANVYEEVMGILYFLTDEYVMQSWSKFISQASHEARIFCRNVAWPMCLYIGVMQRKLNCVVNQKASQFWKGSITQNTPKNSFKLAFTCTCATHHERRWSAQPDGSDGSHGNFELHPFWDLFSGCIGGIQLKTGDRGMGGSVTQQHQTHVTSAHHEK